ncbi:MULTISPECIES: phage tail protein [Fusobacterium]|uniref:phage tail-collar fiber domain-containing protein n=1 Tax=Fusobacterium TaxID=848 RepID=UPI0004504295|nr:phage tail protein [Fusobacterium sp. OBRC1]EUB33177.1 hypothetical protein HMPREF1501_0069 [Fusobacterium sp. OBRC1]DAI15822.1 MAG TPA: tail-collar fiber protein [Caudoviricetes sp.]
MAFRGLTKKGADYLATRLANELAVEFLKVEIGDGAVISGQNPKNQTSLISYKKDVRILKKEQENNAINLTIQITNDDITQGFYLKEIGIYVNDSSSNGCLYWYCNEDNAQYIPAKTDSVIAFEIDIRMEVTNSDATIINWSGKNTWINKEYLEENYTQNGGYKGTAQEIDDRVVSALGKEDGKFPLNEAIQGNVYYFPANKKFYICKETQNRRISVPDVKFEELSIWENRKRLENLVTSYNLKEWNIIEFPSKKIILSLRKNVDYNENPYKFNLPLKITNGVILASSEDIDNQFVFTSTISNNEIIIKRWPNIIGHGHSVVDILIIGDKLS